MESISPEEQKTLIENALIAQENAVKIYYLFLFI
jgi:hypothetical protein